MALQAVAIARHAGAAHDQHVGAVLVAQLGGDLGHAAEGARLVGQLDDAEADRAVAGHAVGHAHLADIAQVARDRLLQDRDHAEALAQGHRGQDAALGDAEHRLGRDLARGMQAGIGVAGDDEGRAVVVAALHRGADRRHDALDMRLGLDARRALLQGHALDRGPPLMRSGSMARSMPSVTAWVELGLITRMRSMAANMASKLLFNNRCSNVRTWGLMRERSR